MPQVARRKIFRLNEERLVAGLLPTPWMIGLGAIAIVLFLTNQPKGIGGIVRLVVTLAIAAVLLIILYRLTKARIIKHFIRWHDAGVGGLIGRDLNPVPHRYYDMTEEERAWLEAKRKEDLARAREVQQQVNALKREEALHKRKLTGRNA